MAKTEAMDTPVPGDRGECAPVLSRAMRARLFTFKPATLVDERASMATPFVASAGPNAAAAAAQREQQEVLRGETAARAALIDLLLSANRCAVECASIPLLPRPICHSDDDEGEDEEDEEEEQQQQREHQQQQRGSKKRDGARARVPRPRRKRALWLRASVTQWTTTLSTAGASTARSPPCPRARSAATTSVSPQAVLHAFVTLPFSLFLHCFPSHRVTFLVSHRKSS